MARFSRKRERSTGRKESGSFVSFPHIVLDSPAFCALSAHGVKLLCDIAAQYKGSNNGDLAAAWSLMQKRGWKSRDTLNNALKALRTHGLIELTRQGGRHNKCSLYGLTWKPIDDCGGKLDDGRRATRVASNLWRNFGTDARGETLARPACQSDTAGVPIDLAGLPIDTAGVPVAMNSLGA